MTSEVCVSKNVELRPRDVETIDKHVKLNTGVTEELIIKYAVLEIVNRVLKPDDFNRNYILELLKYCEEHFWRDVLTVAVISDAATYTWEVYSLYQQHMLPRVVEMASECADKNNLNNLEIDDIKVELERIEKDKVRVSISIRRDMG